MTRETLSTVDGSVAAQMENAVVVRAAAAAIRDVRAAAGTSRLWSPVMAARRAWRGWPVGVRRQFLGVFLLVASAVHVGLVWPRPPAPGWLWLVPPVTAALVGAVLLSRVGGEVDRHVS